MPTRSCWKNISSYHAAKGSHTLRYSFFPHEGDWKKAHAHRRAVEFQEPLMCVSANSATAGAYRLPSEKSFARIAPDSVVMTGFYIQEQRVVVRVYESHGKPAKAKIALPFEIGKADETDFYGSPINDKKPTSGKKVAASGNMLTFEIKPWEIATFFISPVTEGSGR